MVKTRFAPSPTGWLHIGGVRTALFSWLFAKSQGGEFCIRIDDTDTTRSTQDFCDSIINALKSLGLNSDRKLIYQSKRFDYYIDQIELLLNQGHAYYDKVEVTDKTKDTNLDIQYKNRLNKPDQVIRFKNPRDQKIILKDLVHDDITFDPKTFHDVVILRSNGIPTYNLTSVADDADMGITHIIRGDDHLSNTAVQINLFNALGHEVPIFGHLPMIHGIDGKRLSKRHGAVDINSFLSDGYLVEALINYLVKTGWSHGDDEFFTLDELLKLFTIDKVTKSSAIFDYDDLLELAGGKISNVFGPDYTELDSFRRVVRLPMEPYLLVSRVTEINGELGEFKPSTITTEYDIPKNAWYTTDGQIPWAVAVESGQCDLMLISYLGIDFQCRGEQVYRLLDCTLTYLDDMPLEGRNFAL